MSGRIRARKGLDVELPLLTRQEKTQLVDAQRKTYGLSKLFADLGFARSIYFYHRGRLRGADKYADARLAITDGLRTQSPLLRISADTDGTGRAKVLPLGESRAAFDEAERLNRCRYEAASVRRQLGRNQHCARESHQTRLPS